MYVCIYIRMYIYIYFIYIVLRARACAVHCAALIGLPELLSCKCFEKATHMQHVIFQMPMLVDCDG